MALNSTSTMHILDLLCEGPIEGIVGRYTGVYLEETPLSTTDQSQADQEITYDFRYGSSEQAAFGSQLIGTGAQHIIDVNTEIGENYSEDLDEDNLVISRDYGPGIQIRSITDLGTDSCRLLFTIPGLFSTAKETVARGARFSAKIRFKVFVQAVGSAEAYNEVLDKTIEGISTGNYQWKTPPIQLSGIGPWNIKVQKITDGENDFEVSYEDFIEVEENTPLAGSRANRIYWTSLIEQADMHQRYPYTACVAMSISTQAYPSLPTRAYLIKGKKLKIPSNASVEPNGRLIFNGAFDGTLSDQLQWTTCPVCAFYDMVTNNGQYGAGEFVDANNLSWVDLYPLSRYANELITTPDGGQEPRFAINTVIGAQADAYEVLRDLASVFRGMLYWQSNAIHSTADHGVIGDYENYSSGSGTYTPLTPVHLYTNANVNEGIFEYSGTSLKTRSTSVRVKYSDPENLYKTNWVVVENQTLINKYGFQVKEILAFGCTSKWQAQRMGRWLLAVEELDGEVVTFQVGLEGVAVSPGQIFAVQDEMRAGVRIGGRCGTGSSNDVIILDQALPNDDTGAPQLPGVNNKLTCVMPDMSVETRTINSVTTSGVTTVQLVEGFSHAPRHESVWAISADNVALQKFRCTSIQEDGDGKYTIVATEHNDSIYQVADTAQGTLEFQDVTIFDEDPHPPVDITITTSTVNNSFNRTVANWSRGMNGNAISFEVRWKVGTGNWQAIETTNSLSWEQDNLAPRSVLTFQVRAKGPRPWERRSPWSELIHTLPDIGVGQNPDSVTGPDVPDTVPVVPPNAFNVTIQALSADEVILRWDIPRRAGVNNSNLMAIIQHSDVTDGSGTWDASTSLAEVYAPAKSAVLPLMEGEYLIKFEDITTADNGTRARSAAAVSATIDIPNPIEKFKIYIDREDTDTTPFAGRRENIFYSDQSGMVGLVLEGDDRIDNVADWDSIVLMDFTGDRLKQGDYYFENPLSLPGVFNVDLTRTLKVAGVYPSDLWDSRDELIDRWADVDGLVADKCDAKSFFRTADAVITDDEFLFENGDKIQLEDSSVGVFNLMLEENILYGPWTPMEAGRYSGRNFQFRTRLTSDAIDQTPVVSQLGYTMEMRQRTESSSAAITSSAGATAVTFTNAFYDTGATPPVSVGITTSNLQSGDYYEVSSVSRTGFTIHFKNASNASISRSFEYQAVGYGRQES